MRRTFLVLAAVIFILGCARVSVQGSKEPIKVDISMRLDIYQHVEKDINSIEDIVSGQADNPKSADKQGLLRFFATDAYAQEELAPEVREAALRRKARINDLYAAESKGIVGENRLGMLEVRDTAQADAAVKQLVEAENNDRMVIYKSIAAKNGTSVEDVQKLYASRLIKDAPSGTPAEVVNAATGSYEWQVKR